MGRLLEKIKALRASENANKKSIRKIAAVTALVIGNLASVAIGTIAWFSAAMARSNIDTVTGDLNVSIQKVTAYKYEYPYYRNSTDLINYDGVGAAKGYVMTDVNYPSNPQFANQTVVNLGTAESKIEKQYSLDGRDGTIRYPGGDRFRYFLIGDSVFSGLSESDDWATDTGIPFSSSNNVESVDVYRRNIIIPVGARFTVFDARSVGVLNADGKGTCAFFSQCAIESGNPRFRASVVDGIPTLECLKCGIYNFTYSFDSESGDYSLTIDAVSRSDDAIIGNNMLDATMISINNSGSVNESNFSQGVFDQKTTVILDVELAYRNASEISAGLKVIRSRDSGFDYSDDASNTIGYVDEEHPNALLASDFYSFCPLFTDTPYASADEVWTAFHKNQIENTEMAYSRFGNTKEQACVLNLGGSLSSTTIPPGNVSDDFPLEVTASYHCYIAIEYDCARYRYFTIGDRLAKTYKLVRDFRFHFTGEQVSEN